MIARASGARVALLFIGTGLLWGSGFLLIKISVRSISPFQLTLARTAIAAIVLSLIVVAQHRRWPHGWASWWRIGVLGAVGCVLPFTLYAYAGQHIPSGLTSIYNAGAPVATALLSFVALRRADRPRPRALLGVLIGAGGIVIVLAPWNWSIPGGLDPLAQLASIVGVLGIGFAFVWTRRAITPLGLDPISVAAGQMIVATALQAVYSPWLSVGPISLDVWTVPCVAVLGAGGTGIAYAWNFQVIAAWGASAASMVTYLVTLTAVILGVLILGERFDWTQLLGGVLVLAGVALALMRRGPATRPLTDDRTSGNSWSRRRR